MDHTAHVSADMDNYMISYTDYAELAPGAKFASMVVVGFGRNLTQMLDTAAYIDSEPMELFHGLTADQLALITNWGGCQTVLAPVITVTITAPSQCSSGETSDFTVAVDTERGTCRSHYLKRIYLLFWQMTLRSASRTH
jgi:hypothetical protein